MPKNPKASNTKPKVPSIHRPMATIVKKATSKASTSTLAHKKSSKEVAAKRSTRDNLKLTASVNDISDIHDIMPLRTLADVRHVARSIKRFATKTSPRSGQVAKSTQSKQWSKKSTFHDVITLKRNRKSEQTHNMSLDYEKTARPMSKTSTDESVNIVMRKDEDIKKEALSNARGAIARALKKGGAHTVCRELRKLLEELHTAVYMHSEKMQHLHEIGPLFATDHRRLVNLRARLDDNAEFESTQAGMLQYIQRGGTNEAQLLVKFMYYFFHMYMELLNADEEGYIEGLTQLHAQSRLVEIKVRMMNHMPRLFIKDTEFAWVLIWLDSLCFNFISTEYLRDVDSTVYAGKNKNTRRAIMTEYVEVVDFIATYSSREHELKEMTMKMVSVAFTHATRYFKTAYLDEVLLQEEIEAREAAKTEFEIKEMQRVESAKVDEYEHKVSILADMCVFGQYSDVRVETTSSFEVNDLTASVPCKSEPSMSSKPSNILSSRSLHFQPGHSKSREDVEEEIAPDDLYTRVHFSDQVSTICPQARITPDKHLHGDIGSPRQSVSHTDVFTLDSIESFDDSSLRQDSLDIASSVAISIRQDAPSLVIIVTPDPDDERHRYEERGSPDSLEELLANARITSIKQQSETILGTRSALQVEAVRETESEADHDLLARPRTMNADLVANIMGRYKKLAESLNARSSSIMLKPLEALKGARSEPLLVYNQDTKVLHDDWRLTIGKAPSQAILDAASRCSMNRELIMSSWHPTN